MNKLLAIFIISLSLTADTVQAYSNGIPRFVAQDMGDSPCVTLKPRHGGSMSQMSESPFQITVDDRNLMTARRVGSEYLDNCCDFC